MQNPEEKLKTTYFGLWSERKIKEASDLLSALGVKYEVQQQMAEQKVLEEWCAWDPPAENPNIGFHLWISTADLPKLGSKIVERFPERKFGAP